MGARDGAVATPLMLIALLDALPSSANTLVGATGPNQYPLTTQAIFLGANVRIGMADNRYLGLEAPVEHNRQLVQRVTESAYHSQRSLADIASTVSRFAIDPSRIEIS